MAEAPLYISTRGAGDAVPFEEALLRGLANDGGLFVSTWVPPVADDWRERRTFPDLGVCALEPWLREQVDPADTSAIIHDALDFPVPLVTLSGGEWEGVYVLELFHGPTLSFKDFGARTMARFMTHFLRRRGQRVTILVATSGDTGSAVADGFSGRDEVDVVLLYPSGQVSPTQERQLIAARPGVRTFSVRGTFDDCQRMVKEAFLDDSFASLRLSSANSINVGRLLPQMTYYFEAFRKGGFDDAVICVPSGNLGNLTAGTMAALSGLPVSRFLAAHNENDFFPTYLQKGAAEYRDSIRTFSNAMDVGVPSNFERLRHLFPSERLARYVWASSIGDEDTIASMRRVHEESGYVADPHTAVGLETARRYRIETGSDDPVVVLSTAHPAKFPETVQLALGAEAQRLDALADIWTQPTLVEGIEASVDALRRVLL